MENAAKALLIAGAVLIGILVTGAFIFLFRDISKTQVDLEEVKALQQVDEFNKQFTSYEKTLYGHELLSLINMIEDYNTKAINQNLGSHRISITVNSIDFQPNLNDPSLLPEGNHTTTPGVTTNPFRTLRNIKDTMETNPVFSKMSDSERNQIISIWPNRSMQNQQAQLNKLADELAKRCPGYDKDAILRFFEANEDSILNYDDYITFKRSKFDYITTGYEAGSGRINAMTFRMHH